jgi:hypothetical protein
MKLGCASAARLICNILIFGGFIYLKTQHSAHTCLYVSPLPAVSQFCRIYVCLCVGGGGGACMRGWVGGTEGGDGLPSSPPPHTHTHTLKWILKEYNGRVWTWFMWFKVQAISRLLWTWCWTFRFRKCREFLDCRTHIPTIILLTVLVWIYLISINFKRKHNPQYLCWYDLFLKSVLFFSEFDLLTWTVSSTNNKCSNNQITPVKSTVLKHWYFMDFISY